jgi:hypothetical protein
MEKDAAQGVNLLRQVIAQGYSATTTAHFALAHCTRAFGALESLRVLKGSKRFLCARQAEAAVGRQGAGAEFEIKSCIANCGTRPYLPPPLPHTRAAPSRAEVPLPPAPPRRCLRSEDRFKHFEHVLQKRRACFCRSRPKSSQ